MLTVPVRQLGESERRAVERLLDLDPYAAAQVAERVAARGLAWWRAEARILGYGARRNLESLCWLGGNLTPVRANDAGVAAFADLLPARSGSAPRSSAAPMSRRCFARAASWQEYSLIDGGFELHEHNCPYSEVAPRSIPRFVQVIHQVIDGHPWAGSTQQTESLAHGGKECRFELHPQTGRSS